MNLDNTRFIISIYLFFNCALNTSTIVVSFLALTLFKWTFVLSFVLIASYWPLLPAPLLLVVFLFPFFFCSPIAKGNTQNAELIRLLDSSAHCGINTLAIVAV